MSVYSVLSKKHLDMYDFTRLIFQALLEAKNLDVNKYEPLSIFTNIRSYHPAHFCRVDFSIGCYGFTKRGFCPFVYTPTICWRSFRVVTNFLVIFIIEGNEDFLLAFFVTSKCQIPLQCQSVQYRQFWYYNL